MKKADNLIFIPWMLGLTNIFYPFTNTIFFWIVSITFCFLIIVHMFECIVYRKKIMDGPDGNLGFVYTFIYGILYLKTFSNQ